MDDGTASDEEQERAEAEREAAREAERRRLHDWTLRQLGDDWRSSGDGIYYPPGVRPQGRGASLDDELLEQLPDATAESPADSPSRA